LKILLHFALSEQIENSRLGGRGSSDFLISKLQLKVELPSGSNNEVNKLAIASSA